MNELKWHRQATDQPIYYSLAPHDRHQALTLALHCTSFIRPAEYCHLWASLRSSVPQIATTEGRCVWGWGVVLWGVIHCPGFFCLCSDFTFTLLLKFQLMGSLNKLLVLPPPSFCIVCFMWCAILCSYCPFSTLCICAATCKQRRVPLNHPIKQKKKRLKELSSRKVH